MNVYICPTYNCNLSCSHCDIRKKSIDTDLIKIIESAKTLAGAQFTLFGGEPLRLKYVELKQLIDNIDIASISTNLLLLEDCHMSLFKDKNIDISTSWNPFRFTAEQYLQWLKNVKKALDNKLYVTVLVTLTVDLFKSKIIDVLDDLAKINNEYFVGIKFEPLLPSTVQLIHNADEWLSQLYKNWKWPYKNILAENYKNGNTYFCRHTKTIQPDGSIINSCPAVQKNVFIDNCLQCKYNRICRPCVKQPVCSFFEKLYLEVINNGIKKR